MKQSDRKKGVFITLEGIEGVGKSTALQFIDQWFTQHQYPHCLTREPGGTPIAEAIREVILNQNNQSMDSKTELLLFFASRVQHVTELIKPALNQGQSVICDRFTDASYVYQGVGRGIPNTLIASLETGLDLDIQPNLTLLLDAPHSICLERMKNRKEKDRIEQEKAAFFERLRAAYLKRAAQLPNRFKVIDSSGSLEQTQQHIALHLEALMT